MNGRHLLISTLICAQKYTDIPMGARENANGLIIFESTDTQVNTIAEEHGTVDKKLFRKVFREVTSEPHSFLAINYTNDNKNRYLDKDFVPISFEK